MMIGDMNLEPSERGGVVDDNRKVMGKGVFFKLFQEGAQDLWHRVHSTMSRPQQRRPKNWHRLANPEFRCDPAPGTYVPR